jgi:murein DD-endopeptidase MepM/ murein hydrolase activator NlpD|tara:strand:+ start:191 stop:1099 length:909 start_codon:yes stop_codon:yes gene_type:complete
MAKSKKEKEQDLSLFQRISKKVHVVVVNAESFEEKRHFMLSPLNAVVLLSFFAILIIIATYLIIAYTPLKQSIPGMPDLSSELSLRKIDLENIQYLEKVKHQSSVEELYFQNLITILNNEVPSDPTSQDSTYNRDSTDYAIMDFSTSEKDSILRAKIDLREKYELHDKEGSVSQNDDMKGVFFFTPINGSVSASFNLKEDHFGVDIVAPKDEAIMATLDGTVIFKDWTPENGHIIYLQHNYNLISVYKHNSFVLKKIGEFVEVGEPIAIIGSSGRLSTGPHLHFELWHKGIALNPEDYMHFN